MKTAKSATGIRMLLHHAACVFLTDMQKQCCVPLPETGLPGTPLLINGEYVGQVKSWKMEFGGPDEKQAAGIR